jgi:hypothetical protein
MTGPCISPEADATSQHAEQKESKKKVQAAQMQFSSVNGHGLVDENHEIDEAGQRILNRGFGLLSESVLQLLNLLGAKTNKAHSFFFPLFEALSNYLSIYPL